jgi:long-chain acyl-CoA synthetase
MQKEFFKAHFFPEQYSWRARMKSSLLYYLAAFYFNAFPLPQREAGARQTLQYIGELTGDGWSIVIFPEGLRSDSGHMQEFRGGIGMIGSRLEVPVVPGAHRRRRPRLHPTWRMARPGTCACRSARRCGCAATTMPRWRARWKMRCAAL